MEGSAEDDQVQAGPPLSSSLSVAVAKEGAGHIAKAFHNDCSQTWSDHCDRTQSHKIVELGGIAPRFVPATANWWNTVAKMEPNHQGFYDKISKEVANLMEVIRKAEDECWDTDELLGMLLSTEEEGGIEGFGQFTGMCFFRVAILCGLMTKNLEHGRFVFLAEGRAHYIALQDMRCNTDARRGALLTALAKVFRMDEDEIENLLCEVYRKAPKQDAYYWGQDLFTLKYNESGILEVLFKGLEDIEWSVASS
jgi:hypothetical protein